MHPLTSETLSPDRTGDGSGLASNGEAVNGDSELAECVMPVDLSLSGSPAQLPRQGMSSNDKPCNANGNLNGTAIYHKEGSIKSSKDTAAAVAAEGMPAVSAIEHQPEGDVKLKVTSRGTVHHHVDPVTEHLAGVKACVGSVLGAPSTDLSAQADFLRRPNDSQSPADMPEAVKKYINPRKRQITPEPSDKRDDAKRKITEGSSSGRPCSREGPSVLEKVMAMAEDQSPTFADCNEIKSQAIGSLDQPPSSVLPAAILRHDSSLSGVRGGSATGLTSLTRPSAGCQDNRSACAKAPAVAPVGPISQPSSKTTNAMPSSSRASGIGNATVAICNTTMLTTAAASAPRFSPGAPAVVSSCHMSSVATSAVASPCMPSSITSASLTRHTSSAAVSAPSLLRAPTVMAAAALGPRVTSVAAAAAGCSLLCASSLAADAASEQRRPSSATTVSVRVASSVAVAAASTPRVTSTATAVSLVPRVSSVVAAPVSAPSATSVATAAASASCMLPAVATVPSAVRGSSLAAPRKSSVVISASAHPVATTAASATRVSSVAAAATSAPRVFMVAATTTPAPRMTLLATPTSATLVANAAASALRGSPVATAAASKPRLSSAAAAAPTTLGGSLSAAAVASASCVTTVAVNGASIPRVSSMATAAATASSLSSAAGGAASAPIVVSSMINAAAVKHRVSPVSNAVTVVHRGTSAAAPSTAVPASLVFAAGAAAPPLTPVLTSAVSTPRVSLVVTATGSAPRVTLVATPAASTPRVSSATIAASPVPQMSPVITNDGSAARVSLVATAAGSTPMFSLITTAGLARHMSSAAPPSVSTPLPSSEGTAASLPRTTNVVTATSAARSPSGIAAAAVATWESTMVNVTTSVPRESVPPAAADLGAVPSPSQAAVATAVTGPELLAGAAAAVPVAGVTTTAVVPGSTASQSSATSAPATVVTASVSAPQVSVTAHAVPRRRAPAAAGSGAATVLALPLTTAATIFSGTPLSAMLTGAASAFPIHSLATVAATASHMSRMATAAAAMAAEMPTDTTTATFMLPMAHSAANAGSNEMLLVVLGEGGSSDVGTAAVNTASLVQIDGVVCSMLPIAVAQERVVAARAAFSGRYLPIAADSRMPAATVATRRGTGRVPAVDVPFHARDIVRQLPDSTYSATAASDLACRSTSDTVTSPASKGEGSELSRSEQAVAATDVVCALPGSSSATASGTENTSSAPVQYGDTSSNAVTVPPKVTGNITDNIDWFPLSTAETTAHASPLEVINLVSDDEDVSDTDATKATDGRVLPCNGMTTVAPSFDKGHPSNECSLARPATRATTAAALSGADAPLPCTVSSATHALHFPAALDQADSLAFNSPEPHQIVAGANAESMADVQVVTNNQGHGQVANISTMDEEQREEAPILQRVKAYLKKGKQRCSSKAKLRQSSAEYNAGSAEEQEVVLRAGTVPLTKKQSSTSQPFCTCRCKPLDAAKSLTHIFCQALDCCDGVRTGCRNTCVTAKLCRPSPKIAFVALCEDHFQRLRNHQCCPGCGLFCTSGRFYQCKNDGSPSHLFHRECQVTKSGRAYCPHCAVLSSQTQVLLHAGKELHEPPYRDLLPASCEAETLAMMLAAKVKAMSKEPRQTTEGSARLGLRRSASGDSSDGDTEHQREPVVSAVLKNKLAITTSGLEGCTAKEKMDLIQLIRKLQTTDHRELKKTLGPLGSLWQVVRSNSIARLICSLGDGADPNARLGEANGGTSLHVASERGHLVMVHCLLLAGARHYMLDNNLRTAVMLASGSGQLPVVVELVKHGAEIKVKDADGQTALHLAAKAGHQAVVAFLATKCSAVIDIRDAGGWTAMAWATEHCHSGVARYLLGCGADPNLRDHEGNTALHWAAFSDCRSLCIEFVKAGCSLEARNANGDSALHVAARQGHYNTVSLLLAHGALSTAVNNAALTPRDCTDVETIKSALAANESLLSVNVPGGKPIDRMVHFDISRGREPNPITCVNSVDDEKCPDDFTYVTANVESARIRINRSVSSLVHCACKFKCETGVCICARANGRAWYNERGYLKETVRIRDNPVIFECNQSCLCWADCQNRVVQHGSRCQLQLFRTEERGWGVRTLMAIPRGAFICEYTGELISDLEADHRRFDSYLFDLDSKDGDTFCLDGRSYGNIGRFINHHCEPNIAPVHVFVEHQDLRFPRICFFAARDIAIHEELGFDYGEGFWIVKSKDFTCKCGSARCKYSQAAIAATMAERGRNSNERLLDVIPSASTE